MSQALKNLLTLLNLEKIEEGLFRGQSEDLGLRQVFGGQVVGQALYAAKETVPDERLVHSFHSYFLRPGDSKKPIIYDVETLRDGNSFSARRVSAIQNGKPIFYMTASFQAPEAGFEHQKTMPFHNPLKGHVAEPHRQVWIRANGSVPDDLRVHQYLLGYASDLNFLPVALQPHGIGFLEPGIQIATIDHSMWFHRPFNLNEWLLYSVESTSASSARGFVRGEFYTQDGVLVASTVQEGVMRNHN